MPKKHVDSRHKELSEELRAWSQKYGLENNTYVSGLLEALESQKNLSFWASLPPVDYLPKPEMKLKGREIINYTALARNVLIFVPVALTWLAIGRATKAFETYTSANPDAVVNFLDFWQNGYGVLDDFWKISHIAELDFIILSIVIVLIVFNSIYSRLANSRHQQSVVEARKKRDVLALNLTKYLFEKRTPSDLTMKDSLANATNNLVKSSKSIESASIRMRKLSEEGTLPKILKTIQKTSQHRSDTKSTDAVQKE